MIRLLLADNQSLVLARLTTIFDAEPYLEVVGHGRRQPRGRGARAPAVIGRRADGHAHARDSTAWRPCASRSPPNTHCGTVMLTTSNLDAYV